MQSCAIALGPYGIGVTRIMPGTIVTDLNKEDLASDMAKYITGAALLVDGGLFVNLPMKVIDSQIHLWDASTVY